MKKVLIFSLVAIFFTACSEFKLPQLPKVQKKELTKEECEKLVERYHNADRTMTFGDANDARMCELELNEGLSTEEMIKNIERLKD